MKAILVLNEMPKSCYACPLTYIDYDYGANTTRCVIDKDTIPRDGKWDECPLKPLPEKRKREPWSSNEYVFYNNLHKLGWNDCIDKITGGTNEEEKVL